MTVMGIKRLLSMVSVLAGLLTVGFWVPTVAADCLPLPTQAQLKITVNLESEGTYRLWFRQVTPATGNQLYVQVDGDCAIDIAKNQQSDKLSWSGVDSQGQSLLVVLDRGEHTIMLGGDQTGIAVDKGLLTTDHDCIPQDNGDNCFELSESAGELVTVAEPTSDIATEQVGKLTFAIILTSILALAGVLGLLIWHYVSYNRRVVFTALSPKLHWLHKLRHAMSLSTVKHFINHHRMTVYMYAAVLGIFTLLLCVGIATANGHKVLVFEAESGEIIGMASNVADAQASEGSYVLFGGSAPVITGSDQTPVKTTPTNNGGGTGGGGGGGSTGTGGGGGDSGGGTGGGGGGGGDAGTPPGECPAFPAFPDENCTGWEHTGVTLTDCTNLTDNGYIWDDNPIKTFDSCYFSKSLTIQAANVTITRSQVHGHVSTHWSNNYDFRNLTLRDVEIEQEGVQDITNAAVAGHNYSCLRCNVHHTLSGMHFGNNTTIRDSYTHDFQWRDEAHGAGIGTGQDHGTNSSIIHNNIQCNRISGPPICSSALSIYPEDDNGDGITVHNVQVEKNLFNATGAYCVYAVSIAGSNINFIDNYFGKKFYPECAGYGPVTGYGPAGGQWINNVWADGSGPVVPS